MNVSIAVLEQGTEWTYPVPWPTTRWSIYIQSGNSIFELGTLKKSLSTA